MSTVTSDEFDTLRQKKQEYRRLQDEADRAKKEHDTLQQDIIERMKAEDQFGFRSGAANFTRKSTIYGHVQDRDKFIAWVRENQMDDELLKVKEESRVLNEIVRARIDNQEELPPGVGFYAREYISIQEN